MAYSAITAQSKQIQCDISAVNDNLLYLLDLLTPMEGQFRTAQEQVYFETALTAARLLPISNNTELQKYF